MAIRISAEKLGKAVALRANPLRLTHSPKVLLPAMPYRRSYGLSRRGAAAPLLAMTSINLVGLRTSKHG